MILVVGGAGYVGSVLVRELLERGYAVKVFDRLYYGDQGIREVLERIKLVAGDIRTMDGSVLDEVDAVINLSGLSNDPTAEYNPKANFEMNTQATEHPAKIWVEASAIYICILLFHLYVGIEMKRYSLDEVP
jgi:nucleoside-diphosphate-sugar epimerase